MPNAIKNTNIQPSKGLTKNGNIASTYISLEPDGGIGPTTNQYDWFNGIVPLPGKYIIYANDFSSASGPRIYAPQSDAELIRLANSLGFGADTVNEALYSFAINVGYFVVNKSYPNIVTSNLVYSIDSTFTTSYPTANTQTVPLRNPAGVGNGTLENGVGWDSNSMSFIFDGSDDQIPINNSNNFANIDWSTGFTLMVLYKIDAVTDFNGQFRCMIGVTGGSRSWNYYLYGPTNPATTLLYHFSGQMSSGLSSAVTVTPDTYHLGVFTIAPGTGVGTYYHDGVVVSTQAAASSPSYTTSGGTQYLGRGDNMWKGNIAKWMIYNKALTQAEIYQNYYQGNIVTNGLVFYTDAGNLASYANPATTTYSLTGSFVGSLVNGTGYSSAYGGIFNLDGTNDYIQVPYDNYWNSNVFGTATNFTISCWAKPNLFKNWDTLISKCDFDNVGGWYSGGEGASIWTNADGFQGVFSSGVAGNPGGSVLVISYTTSNTQKWYNVCFTGDGTTLRFYIDGVEVGSGLISDRTYPVSVTATGPSFGKRANFNGQMTDMMLYTRALSPQEIQQNFSTQSSKFI